MDPTGTMPGQGLDEPFGDLDGLGFLSREEEQATRLRGPEGSSWGNGGGAG
jgi:hypothetical protein